MSTPVAQDEVDFTAVWNNALNTVADTMSAQQNAFLRLARLVGLIDNTVLLAVPNDFTKGVLEERLAAPLTDALSDQLGRARQRRVFGRLPGPQPG